MEATFVKCGGETGTVVVIAKFAFMDEAVAAFRPMQPGDTYWIVPSVLGPGFADLPRAAAERGVWYDDPVPAPAPLSRAERERRGLPLTREAALKPPLTGGPASNARVDTLWSDDEDMDILDAGGRGEHALDAVAFRLHRGVGEVRRRYRQLTEGVRRELEG